MGTRTLFLRKPHRFENTWNYKAGFIEYLKYQVDLTKNNHGTHVTTRIWLEPSNKYFKSSEHNGLIIIHTRAAEEDMFTFYITDENFHD